MKSKSWFASVVVLVVGLSVSGCSTVKTRVFPKSDGSFQMVATSYNSESDALDGALEKGNEYCQQRGKAFVMTDQKSEYNGMDKNMKGVIGVADTLLSSAAGPGRHHHSLYGATHNQDDHKVTMNFKCN